MIEFTSPVGPIIIFVLAGGLAVFWLVVLVAGIVGAFRRANDA